MMMMRMMEINLIFAKLGLFLSFTKEGFYLRVVLIISFLLLVEKRDEL